jgi:hypothetical protein
MGELTTLGLAGGSAYMGDMTSTKKMAVDAMRPVGDGVYVDVFVVKCRNIR